MALKVMQYRYYGEPRAENDEYKPAVENYSNYPSGINADVLSKNMNNVFARYTPIYQLGVQGLPGTKFYINDSPSPIVIGYSGIYELDIGERMQILSLKFDRASLETISNIPSAYLIVDILYKDESTDDQANVNAPNTIEVGQIESATG